MELKEPSLLKLSFDGLPLGTLGFREAPAPVFALEFDPAFLDLSHDLSPLKLPFEECRRLQIFKPGGTPFPGGLPGLIADSLPDSWGERMLHSELPGLTTVLGKLAAIGQRGPGAITYAPVLGDGEGTRQSRRSIERLAAEVAALPPAPAPLTSAQVDRALALGGSSLGGAYPKVTAHLPFQAEQIERREILIGGRPPQGHSPCILKLSTKDNESGSVEFAFWLMARKAGIEVPRSCLVHDGSRRHFASMRFDRFQKTDGSWGRHHVHTLSGMLHRPPSSEADRIDYSEFMRLALRLTGPAGARECLRRAVFNLLATNRDDHGRNHAFRYQADTRTWQLSPAYDLNPNVANILVGLSWLGSTNIPSRFEQLVALAEIGGIMANETRAIYEQVEEATLGSWMELSKQAHVPSSIAKLWEHEMISQTRRLRESKGSPRTQLSQARR